MTAAPQFRSELLRTLQARGYIHQVTHAAELDEAAAKGVVTGYIGFDATAPSLHVGSMMQIMTLRRLQQAGHRPIVVMGGGTTKVGDPSGKDESRKLLSDADIAANIASIRKVFERFLTFGEGPTDAVMVDNAEWLDRLGYIEFLREYGTHFTVNRMLTFDSVRLRLDREQPLTFIEFNYMLMQAVDFLELYRRYGCALQMGGSDQWGNIVNGVELIRRVDQGEAFGLTTPLIATASGAKMGKTAAGAVWLNADLVSPYDYWQYWRNTEDADVRRFMLLFTDLTPEEVEDELRPPADINNAKKKLARAATTMLHGEEAAMAAERKAEAIFERGEIEIPTVELVWSGGQDFEIRTPEALVHAAGLASSLREARKFIANSEIMIDGQTVSGSERYRRENADPTSGTFRVQKGKKKIVLVKPV